MVPESTFFFKLAVVDVVRVQRGGGVRVRWLLAVSQQQEVDSENYSLPAGLLTCLFIPFMKSKNIFDCRSNMTLSPSSLHIYLTQHTYLTLSKIIPHLILD